MVWNRVIAPVAAAVLLYFTGHRTGAALVFGVALVLLCTGLIRPDLGRAIDRQVGRLGASAARAVSSVISWIGWALMVLPIWLWHKSYMARSDDLRHLSEYSLWQSSMARGARGSESRAGSAMGGQSTYQRRRGPRHVALLATVLVVAVGAYFLGSHTGPSAGGDYGLSRDRSLLPDAPPTHATGEPTDAFNGLSIVGRAYDGDSWAPHLFGELGEVPYRPDLILGNELNDFVGKYVNITDGRRASYSPDDADVTIWFFGGSTMFGIGQRDGHTIPSEFARLAERNGLPVRVENFGVSAYVNWQETEVFERMLTADGNRPDLVVFYDGVNEVGTAFQRLEIGDTDPTAIRRPGVSDLERAQLRHNVGNTGPAPAEKVIDLAAGQYRRGVEIGRRLAASYGIPVTHFWQPQINSKKHQPFDSELLDRLNFTPEQVTRSAEVYDQVRKRSDVDPVDISHVFDDLDEPVLFDWSHTNELGAQVVAEAIFGYLRPQIEGLVKG